MRARYGLRLIMKIGVDVVDDLFSDFNECSAPAIATVKCWRIGSVKIFANVNATLIQERKKDLEAGQLMACHVATIVKHNVDTAHFRYD